MRGNDTMDNGSPATRPNATTIGIPADDRAAPRPMWRAGGVAPP
jgi:hypothetical protein